VGSDAVSLSRADTQRTADAPPRDQDWTGEARIRELVKAHDGRHPTVQEFILAVLREAILEGVLPPHARLRQEDLATVFGTSRIPVREALRVLEYEGLAESEPNRGFAVTSLDADQIEEIYDLRIVLESHATRLAIPLLTDGDVSDLEELYREMQESDGSDARLAKREQFYLRLYGVTARPRLVGLIARLRQEVARSLRSKLVHDSPTNHQAYFDAVKRGDADTACEELALHYRKVAALLRRFLREAKSGVAADR
jgi:DNA-binding GntR family transcriptional regulator